MITLHLFAFLLLPYLITSQPFGISPPKIYKTVTTSFGKLEGRVINLNIPGLGPVEEYLGVPYASPPVGQKRFMPPNSAAKWSATKDATRLPPVCVQMFPNSFAGGQAEALKWMPESHYRYLQRLRRLYLKNQSEDCLYLNLYVPERKGKMGPFETQGPPEARGPRVFGQSKHFHLLITLIDFFSQTQSQGSLVSPKWPTVDTSFRRAYVLLICISQWTLVPGVYKANKGSLDQYSSTEWRSWLPFFALGAIEKLRKSTLSKPLHFLPLSRISS